MCHLLKTELQLRNRKAMLEAAILGEDAPAFNPTTRIPVAVPFDSEISLKVYNITGQQVSWNHLFGTTGGGTTLI